MSDDLKPGDEAPEEEPSASKTTCPACSGSGERDGAECADCAGTGEIEQAVGGG